MLNSNVRISKYMKLNTRKTQYTKTKNRLNSSSYNFCIFLIRQEISRLEAHIYVKVLNHRKTQKCFSRMSKMCSIESDQISDQKVTKSKDKNNLNFYTSNLVLPDNQIWFALMQFYDLSFNQQLQYVLRKIGA